MSTNSINDKIGTRPGWRNWQTRKTQNLVERKLRVGSSPSPGTKPKITSFMTNHPIDEYLDLVDKQDNVIGKMRRSEVYEKNLSNFRVIVESGETYEEALKRELFEELIIDTETIPYHLLGHLAPHGNNISAFMNVYEINMDECPKYNTGDFVEYFWLSPKDLISKLKNGEKSKDDLPKLVKIFYKT